MTGGRVLGYRRPAMLGGPDNPDPGALTVRWYGTSNFELNFAGRVVLLDTFYDRGPRMRGLGFRPGEVVRADAVLIGIRTTTTSPTRRRWPRPPGRRSWSTRSAPAC
jgi:hypothetical protein